MLFRSQNVKPKLLIGLTSSSSMETLHGCAQQAEGLIIPTSFAPVTEEAKKAAAAVQAFNPKYNMDLHNAAAFENIFTLKEIIEKQKVMGRPDTVQADRQKIRDGLAGLKQTQGLLGKVGRTEDREAVKPYLFVQAASNPTLSRGVCFPRQCVECRQSLMRLYTDRQFQN